MPPPQEERKQSAELERTFNDSCILGTYIYLRDQVEVLQLSFSRERAMVCLLGVRVKYLGGEQVASCVYAPSKVSSVRCYATTWAWRGWTMVYSVMRSSPYYYAYQLEITHIIIYTYQV